MRTLTAGALAALAALAVGCQAQQASTVATAPSAPATLKGDQKGSEFLAASPAQQLAYCVSSVKAYKTSGVQSFSVSPSIGNLTPDGFCEQLTDYFNDEPVRKEERLSQAAAAAILLYARPKGRTDDAELDQMETRR